jgi:tetratricopeptide (TPR) repeat protein
MVSLVGCARSFGALAALVLLASCAASGPGGAPAGPAASGDGAPPGDPVAELDAARQALDKNPESLEATFRYGLAWQRRAESSGETMAPAYLDSANAHYDKVLFRDPENVKALVHSGLVLEDLGRKDEALSRYQKATEAAPEDPRPFVNLGSLLYFGFSKTYDAKVALQRALELDPDNADAHFNLGVLFADATLYREARVEWERVAAGADGPAKALALQNLEKIRPLLAAQDSAAGAAAGR